jgi:DNA polymerase-3 subunit epsilon
MREIVFDTETTGLEAESDRLIEIGCVELENLLPTGREFHTLINPMREVHLDAARVHGFTWEKLRGYPIFAEQKVMGAFLAFIGDAPLVAHNASFDRGFINAELRRAGKPALADDRFVDTLKLAQAKFPGAPASLDALCRRFEISIEHRALHGAIKDARLLAGVYLELNGGRERSFGFELAHSGSGGERLAPLAQRPTPLPSRITEAERQAHAALVAKLGSNSVWAGFLAAQSPQNTNGST